MADKITVKRDDQADLAFSGELIASASSHCNQVHEQIRWTELCLWRTDGGRFVAGECQRTIWPNETDSYTAQICDDKAGVVETFGYSNLAKSIYEQAKIDATEAVA